MPPVAFLILAIPLSADLRSYRPIPALGLGDRLASPAMQCRGDCCCACREGVRCFCEDDCPTRWDKRPGEVIDLPKLPRILR